MITLNHLGISHAVIIALPERAEHVSRLKNSMIDGGIDPESGVTILPAWNGRELRPPKSWKGTRGAWGCVQSHIRALRLAVKNNWESVLILEDDAIFCRNAAVRLQTLFAALPKDWRLLYLGGYHQNWPKEVHADYILASGMTATHAYIVKRESVPWLIKHIAYYPDYEQQQWGVDQQIRNAVYRGDILQYAPRWNIVGQQRQEYSTIAHSRAGNRERWWEHSQNDQFRLLPLVLLREPLTVEDVDGLEELVDIAPEKSVESLLEKTEDMAGAIIEALSYSARGAFSHRRVPALYYSDRRAADRCARLWSAECLFAEAGDSDQTRELLVTTLRRIVDYAENPDMNPDMGEN